MSNSTKNSTGRSFTNYGVARFDGKGDFGTWKMKMEAVLKKERTFKVVSDPDKLKNLAPEEIEEDALTTIQLSLSNKYLESFLM